MPEIKKPEPQRHNYLITVGVLIILLALASLINNHQKKVVLKPANRNTGTYSQTLETNPVASSTIMQEAIDQNEIQSDISQTLQTGQKVDVPQISDSLLNIQANSKSNVVKYLNSQDSLVSAYNSSTEDVTKNLFDPATKAADLDKAILQTQNIISSLYKLPVPKDALQFHKDTINIYQAYLNLMGEAKLYNLKEANDPWKNVYYNYALINELTANVDNEFAALKNSYSLQ